MILLFDTETTGLISYKKELSDPSQPRILSIAAILCDISGNVIEGMNTLIHHPNLEIPEFITKLNGITQEICEKDGIPISTAIEKFNDMKARSHTRVAHNLSFDKQMITREELALGMEHLGYHGESFCTMQMCRTLGMKGNLQSMYTQLFGKSFEGQHTASGDVTACKEIFFKVKVS